MTCIAVKRKQLHEAERVKAANKMSVNCSMLLRIQKPLSGHSCQMSTGKISGSFQISGHLKFQEFQHS